MREQNILIGKTITAIKIADDKGAVKFETTNEDIIARCDADCCSYTWVEHIELPALGLPALVIDVNDLDMPDGEVSTFHPDSDSLQFYGCKITTDKGEIVIDYRNDSNGYYGGSLTWSGDYFYGGVYGQNKSSENWIDLV